MRLLNAYLDTLQNNIYDIHRELIAQGKEITSEFISYSRISLAICVGQSLKGEGVVAVMNQLKVVNLAVPSRIQQGRLAVDNGSEFISKALDKWCYDNGVTLDFSGPGKPTDNPFIELFNGSFREAAAQMNV